VIVEPASSWRLSRRLSAPQLLVLSFVGLVVVGWAGFMLLPGLYTVEPLGWVDALFMATSAICVTGLSVVDVSSAFTVWGQAWLLALIQAGGLGILTFAGVVTWLVSGRSRLVLEEAAGGPASVLPAGSPMRLLQTALGVTATLELAGAVVLWALWHARYGAHAIWLAAFHSISAFCNAGFSLFPDSFVRFRQSPGLLLCVSALIVAGGLGFPVIQDFRYRLAGRHRRLTTHSRLVLVTTGLLVAVSALGYLVFESGDTLAGLGTVDRVVNSIFMAITPRTAGFNTVDYDQLSNEALFLTLGLMWVGGGPASLAGGVKITTVALLGLLLWARLRGETHVSVGGRTIPPDTVQRATGLAVGGLLLVGLFVFLVLWAEPSTGSDAADHVQLVHTAFEVQSALSTVGLSMGVTPELTRASRLLLVVAMLVGRVGPLAAVGAMVLRQKNVSFRYAYEDVLTG
jgi:trk/ktr system potassium uptake protein